MKTNQLDFLEPHEQEEYLSIVRSRKRERWWTTAAAAVKGAFTVGPLKWYWRTFPWVLLMMVFIFGAIAFSQPHPLPIIETWFCVIQAIDLGFTSFCWLVAKADED